MSKLKISQGFVSLMVCLSFLAAAACSTGASTPFPDALTDTDTTETLTCTDFDGDGRGRGCSQGGDCDDSDAEHWSDCSNCNITHAHGCACSSGDSYFCYEGPSTTQGIGKCQRGVRSCVSGQLGICAGQVLPDLLETCGNDIDDNCNGISDSEDPMCSDCSPPCYTDGAAIPSPDDPGSSGLSPNPDGPGVILGSSSEEAGFAWIANSSEGTVTKLNITTGTEVGRFKAGLTGTGTDSPSRTAVDDYQSAYVANRAFDVQGSVTKIAGIERYCIDRNGSGAIDTSRNSVPMELGQDECVLWTAPVGGVNGVPRALVIDFGSIDTGGAYPWVGCYYEQKFYKLDPADGTVLQSVDVNVTPYGAAIDSQGWIWISGRGNQAIQRFHYIGGVVEPPISIPSGSCGGNEPYGITVDRSDRVWVGILPGTGACRYEAASATWFPVGLGGSGRGVAVDIDNNIWASNYDTFQLHRFAADDGSGLATWSLVGAPPAVGVGVDRNGLIWTIAQGSNSVARFNPSTSAFESLPVGAGPYTYSDFLGYQRWLMMPNGLWIGTFERCDERDGDKWLDLTWDTETPDDSKITIKARSADTMGGILSATEVIIAAIGPDLDAGSINLEDAYSEAGVTLGKFIEITVIMQPSSADTPISPVFKGLQLFYYCTSLG